MFEKLTGGFAVVVVLLVIAIGGVTFFGLFNTTTHTGCVVTDKDRTRDSNGNSDARIYTDNCGTFQVADSLTRFRFDSADDYAAIKVGQTYDFDTYGFRIGVFSMFPNIVESKPSEG